MANEKNELSELKGFRKNVIQNLKDAGYDSLEKISNASVDELKKIPGIGVKTAEKLIDACKNLMSEKHKTEVRKEEKPSELKPEISEVPEIRMKGVLFSYRRGGATQKTSEGLIKILEVANKSVAAQLIGKKVILSYGNKTIRGKIVSTHGNNGIVRARFSHGLSGQALGKQVIVL